MANPLFQQFGVSPEVTQLMQEAKQLEKVFQGDPKQTVEAMLRDGRMSQQQFNAFAQIANQIMGMTRG